MLVESLVETKIVIESGLHYIDIYDEDYNCLAWQVFLSGRRAEERGLGVPRDALRKS